MPMLLTALCRRRTGRSPPPCRHANADPFPLPQQAAEALANAYDQPLTKSYIEESLRRRSQAPPADAPLWGRRGPAFDETARKTEVPTVRAFVRAGVLLATACAYASPSWFALPHSWS